MLPSACSQLSPNPNPLTTHLPESPLLSHRPLGRGTMRPPANPQGSCPRLGSSLSSWSRLLSLARWCLCLLQEPAPPLGVSPAPGGVLSPPGTWHRATS